MEAGEVTAIGTLKGITGEAVAKAGLTGNSEIAGTNKPGAF